MPSGQGFSVFSALFLVLEELIGDDKGLIITLLDGLLDLLIISLTDVNEVHGLDLRIDLLIDLKAILFLERVASRHFGIQWHFAPDPRMAQDLMNPYTFVGIYLQHPANEIRGKRVEVYIVGDGVIAL